MSARLRRILRFLSFPFRFLVALITGLIAILFLWEA